MYKGGIEGRQTLLRLEGTKCYHLGWLLSRNVKKTRSIFRDSYRKMVCRAMHHTGPCLYVVWQSDSQAIVCTWPHRRRSPSLSRQSIAIPNKGSGYANVALLLLYNYGHSLGRGVNSGYILLQSCLSCGHDLSPATPETEC